MPARRDARTVDMFDVPTPPLKVPGALNIALPLRHLLSAALKECPYSRYEIAARMSELLGVEITKFQLDSWTAESRDGWRFPLEYLPAFEVVCETYVISEFVMDRRGCRVLVGEDVLLTEVGRIERQEQELKRRKAALKQRLRGST